LVQFATDGAGKPTSPSLPGCNRPFTAPLRSVSIRIFWQNATSTLTLPEHAGRCSTDAAPGLRLAGVPPLVLHQQRCCPLPPPAYYLPYAFSCLKHLVYPDVCVHLCSCDVPAQGATRLAVSVRILAARGILMRIFQGPLFCLCCRAARFCLRRDALCCDIRATFRRFCPYLPPPSTTTTPHGRHRLLAFQLNLNRRRQNIHLGADRTGLRLYHVRMLWAQWNGFTHVPCGFLPGAYASTSEHLLNRKGLGCHRRGARPGWTCHQPI